MVTPYIESINMTAKLEKWKTFGTVQTIILEDFAENKVSGKIFIQKLLRKVRIVRAFKRFAVYWGAAIVSVILPILHFILVPGFLIAGPVMAFIRYNQKSNILGGLGICPNCEEKLVLEQINKKWPQTESCPNCRRNLKISLINKNVPPLSIKSF